MEGCRLWGNVVTRRGGDESLVIGEKRRERKHFLISFQIKR